MRNAYMYKVLYNGVYCIHDDVSECSSERRRCVVGVEVGLRTNRKERGGERSREKGFGFQVDAVYRICTCMSTLTLRRLHDKGELYVV